MGIAIIAVTDGTTKQLEVTTGALDEVLGEGVRDMSLVAGKSDELALAGIEVQADLSGSGSKLGQSGGDSPVITCQATVLQVREDELQASLGTSRLKPLQDWLEG